MGKGQLDGQMSGRLHSIYGLLIVFRMVILSRVLWFTLGSVPNTDTRTRTKRSNLGCFPYLLTYYLKRGSSDSVFVFILFMPSMSVL